MERETYQRLSDAGLLPAVATRLLLHEVDDQIEELGIGRATLTDIRHREQPRFDRFMARVTSWPPSPAGDDPFELAYAEASARQPAAQRTGEALGLFARMPNVDPDAVETARRIFARWEEAIARLREFDADETRESRRVRRNQAETLMRVASTEALDELSGIGLLPEALARQAAGQVAAGGDDEP